LILGIALACKKDDDEDTNNNNDSDVVNVEKSTVSAKWEVEGDSDYETFEFNESGTYVVVKNSPDKDTDEEIIILGTYLIDGNLLILSDFGIVKVISLNEEQISFSVKLEGETDYGDVLIGNRSDELPVSDKTTLLCRTWKVKVMSGDTLPEDEQGFVTFFKSGTYITAWAGDEVAKWKWYDSNENSWCYSWNEEIDCENYVIVTELTTSVHIFHLPGAEDYPYVLEPWNNSKSYNSFYWGQFLKSRNSEKPSWYSNK